jgi:hypothetical protein
MVERNPVPGGVIPVNRDDDRAPLRRLLEIDETALHICAGELNAEPLTDIQALETAHLSSFYGWMQETDPGALVRRAGDESVEVFSDSRLQQHGCRGFTDLPFDLLRRILCFGAVLREGRQLIIPIRLQAPGQSCFQQPLRD